MFWERDGKVMVPKNDLIAEPSRPVGITKRKDQCPSYNRSILRAGLFLFIDNICVHPSRDTFMTVEVELTT